MEVKNRPLTPFMLFCVRQREKNEVLTTKELAALWQSLSKSKKTKYLDAYKNEKKKYDKYLEGVYGTESLTYQSKEKIKDFSLVNIRAILGQKSDIKPLSKEAYPMLIKLLVNFNEIY